MGYYHFISVCNLFRLEKKLGLIAMSEFDKKCMNLAYQLSNHGKGGFKVSIVFVQTRG